jgi:hypothetical protein
VFANIAPYSIRVFVLVVTNAELLTDFYQDELEIIKSTEFYFRIGVGPLGGLSQQHFGSPLLPPGKPGEDFSYACPTKYPNSEETVPHF